MKLMLFSGKSCNPVHNKKPDSISRTGPVAVENILELIGVQRLVYCQIDILLRHEVAIHFLEDISIGIIDDHSVSTEAQFGNIGLACFIGCVPYLAT